MFSWSGACLRWPPCPLVWGFSDVYKRQQYELTTAETQRRAAEDEVLRLQGVKNQFDMLLSNLRESVENLAGEIEAIDGRIQENEVRNAAAEQTVADREGEAASCRVQAEAILSAVSYTHLDVYKRQGR